MRSTLAVLAFLGILVTSFCQFSAYAFGLVSSTSQQEISSDQTSNSNTTETNTEVDAATASSSSTFGNLSHFGDSTSGLSLGPKNFGFGTVKIGSITTPTDTSTSTEIS